jgi:hypothetical protein
VAANVGSAWHGTATWEPNTEKLLVDTEKLSRCCRGLPGGHDMDMIVTYASTQTNFIQPRIQQPG